MYKIIKKVSISASHKIKNSDDGKCENYHGHNWVITVHLRSESLDNLGMVYNFTNIKKIINEKLDHTDLNKVIEQPTSENIAKYVADIIGDKCFKVEVQECEGNIAIYER